MASRGRRAGYNNYSLQDQMLLCQIVEEVLPLGRNMWEQVAVKYNANRHNRSPERDFESLRRKFKSMYTKKKPTGSGEVPLRLKPVVWAKDIQRKIDAEGGALTSHDGLDHGEDDEALETVVNEAVGDTEERRSTAATATHHDREDSASVEADENDAASSEEDATDGGVVRTMAGGLSPLPTATQGDAISQYAQSSPPATARDQNTGVIMTSIGPIDATLASHYDFSALSDDENPTAQPPLAVQPGGSDAQLPSQEAVSGSPTIRTEASRGNDGAAVDQPTTARSSGRPRGTPRGTVPTVASPDGPELRRDPRWAQRDARETASNPNLRISSNRLGGGDLRVFRDNVDAMARTLLNDNGKRSSTDTASGNVSFSKAKRIRAKKRLEEMQKEFESAERMQASAGGEVMKLLLFFQQDSDRRAEAEERRRRAEREEREEAEKRDRAERESIRREEAEAAERRRLQEVESAREQREEQRRIDTAREAKLDLEREENNRRYEERLALERSEARQRHEEMIMMLAGARKQN